MTRMTMGLHAAMAVLLALLLALRPGPATAAPGSVLIEHVNVLPMTPGSTVLADRSVLIEGGRITSLDAAGQPAQQRIDGRGQWLMPALADMHVHLENDRLLRLYLRQPGLPAGAVHTEDVMAPYLANGVLQVFNLSAMPETLAQKAEVDSGRVPGPHIATAAMIDGEPPILPDGVTRVAATPEAGRQAVRDAAAEGHGFIKAYGRLDLATFSAVVDEARKLRLRVVGHIPQRGKGLTEKFFQPGFDLVAHAEEFAQQTDEPSEADIPRYVDMARRNGTALVATLSLDERILEAVSDAATLKQRPELRYLHPMLHLVTTEHNPYTAEASPEFIAHVQRIVRFNRKLVAAFAQAGIPVLAGTDAPVPGIVPGFALHDELLALARAGLSPAQVLAAATRQPAEWLGVAGDRGTVAVGQRANLLLLGANPLQDVANTRRINAVILNGQVLPRAELDRRLQTLDAHHAATRKQLGLADLPP